jgi:tetratricopeptide (TPR) repeat protein
MTIVNPKNFDTRNDRPSSLNSLSHKISDVSDASVPIFPSDAQAELIHRIQTLAGSPANEAVLLNALGYHYLRPPLPARAESLLNWSLTIRRDNPKIGEGAVIPALLNLAALRSIQGNPHAAETLLREAFDLADQDERYRVRILRNLAGICETQGKLVEAERQYRDALEIQTANEREEAAETAWLRNNLAFTLQRVEGRTKDAEALYRENLEPHRRSNPLLSGPVDATLRNLAALLRRLGRTAEADALLQERTSLQEERLDGEPLTQAPPEPTVGDEKVTSPALT